jgi:aspartate racemase
MDKVLGVIGGMSWTSTAVTYRRLNEGYQRLRGRLHSAPLVLWSFDFQHIEDLQREGDWATLALRMAEAGQRLHLAGADALLLATNTMHKLASPLQAAAGLPLIHIADAAAWEIGQRGLDRVGLLGTRFTMTEDFYTSRLGEAGVQVLIPEERDAAEVDRIIFEELCADRVLPESRVRLAAISQRLADRGAQAVVLGCTELPLLAGELPLPAIDTVEAQVQAALRWWSEG